MNIQNGIIGTPIGSPIGTVLGKDMPKVQHAPKKENPKKAEDEVSCLTFYADTSGCATIDYFGLKAF